MVRSKNSNSSDDNIKLTALLPTTSVAGSQTYSPPTADDIEWVSNKGLYYPFSKVTGGSEVVEFRIQGKVMECYLRADPSYSHSISLEITSDQVDLIKSYVYNVPNFDSGSYRWPFVGMVAKFTSKEELNKAFRDVWEVDDEDSIDNERLRLPISVDRVKKGTTVWVEYTIVPYMGKKGTKDDQVKFDPGCTLRLLSIGMLNGVEDNSRYDFGSLRKKRRMADSNKK